MLRFLPDTWFDGLIRPLLLADPSAGLYYELGAPDWRFAALVALVLVALLTGRLRRFATAEHLRSLAILVAMFYAWTFTIGNGRYFIAGLLMVGPLVVMAWRWLPGTTAFRWTALAGLLVMQAYTVASMYRPNAWALAGWAEGPALYLSETPVRLKPAVFVTVSGISYSSLVPKFHPDSRWANLSGQVDMTPDRPEYPAVQAMLASPLPKYAVLPAPPVRDGRVSQPDAAGWAAIGEALSRRGLKPTGAPCETLRSSLGPRAPYEPGTVTPVGRFWVCPIEVNAEKPDASASDEAMDPVFAALEAYCPRFFPPNGAATRRYAGYWERNYIGSDTKATISDAGTVLVKYFRNFTPTVVGTVDDVRQGRLSFNCTSLPGRYRVPWATP